MRYLWYNFNIYDKVGSSYDYFFGDCCIFSPYFLIIIIITYLYFTSLTLSYILSKIFHNIHILICFIIVGAHSLWGRRICRWSWYPIRPKYWGTDGIGPHYNSRCFLLYRNIFYILYQSYSWGILLSLIYFSLGFAHIATLSW